MTGLPPDLVCAAARAWIGTPYRHQASLKGVGCDCLGLVRGVWRDLVGPEPEEPPPYGPPGTDGSGVEALTEALGRWCPPASGGPAAGRILVLRLRSGAPARHCAIATGPTTMIHAQDGAAVAEVPLPPLWHRRIAAVFVFPRRPS